jgi:hypothetical protein
MPLHVTTTDQLARQRSESLFSMGGVTGRVCRWPSKDVVKPSPNHFRHHVLVDERQRALATCGDIGRQADLSPQGLGRPGLDVCPDDQECGVAGGHAPKLGPAPSPGRDISLRRLREFAQLTRRLDVELRTQKLLVALELA